MDLLFSIICILWLASEVLLNRLLRSKSQDKQGADNNSLRLIWMSIVLSVVAATFISQRFSFPISSNENIMNIGLCIIVSGIVLRLLVIRTMGHLFTVDVTIRTGHTLKTDGFFGIVRHPSYLASLISFVGFGIALNNWVSLIVVFIPVLMSFIRRIQIEEKVLIGQFGEAYLQYKKRTKRLIPFMY